MIIYNEWELLYKLLIGSVGVIAAVILDAPGWLIASLGVYAGAWLTLVLLSGEYVKSDNQTDSIPEATNDH